MNIEQIIEAVKGMTVLELNDLVKRCEQEFGVSASAQIVANVDSGAAPVEEKTEFDVILTSYGEKKINVIKVVRELTGLGLKEAKDLVDGVPKPLKEAINKEEAESIKARLEEVGAKVEIK